jgi:rhamnogalacturonyl hydrolase YesR
MKIQNRRLFQTALLLLLPFVVASTVSAQSKYFKKWDAGTSPREIGQRVSQNWLARPFDYESGKRKFVIYPEICVWYGALTVADETGDKQLRQSLLKKFDRFLTPAGAAHINPAAHVDYSVFGVVPLEIYRQTKDRKYFDLGKGFADKQWEKTTPDGITQEARYWIDDMYMITAIQTQAYRSTKDKKYLDRAALAAAAYLGKLQQPNGLFFHAPDSQFYWSRGNGWFAAGMTELLTDLPKNHPQRPEILKSFRTMMASLLKYQTADGLWRQLIDKPESWEETSGTGMFAFAMVTGVKNGWLEEDVYGPAARKAWLGLVKHIDANANVTEVCEGTDKGFSVQYYLDRKRKTGDLHGQAPILWTATALLR